MSDEQPPEGEKKRRRRRRDSMSAALPLLMASAMVGTGYDGDMLSPFLPRGLRGPPPEPTPCCLPGCEVLSHRDYCSAEHFEEHRAIQKKVPVPQGKRKLSRRERKRLKKA